MVSWWITGEHGLGLSLAMSPVTLHCTPLVSSREKPALSSSFPLQIYQCAVQGSTLLLQGVRGADLMHHWCSSTSFHGIVCPTEPITWTHVIASVLPLRWAKKRGQSKVKMTWQVNFFCHLFAEIKSMKSIVIIRFDLSFLRCHSQRLSIAKEFGDKAAERRAYSNLGNALIFLGQFNTATEYYRWEKRGAWHLVEGRQNEPISAKVKMRLKYQLNMKKLNLVHGNLLKCNKIKDCKTFPPISHIFNPSISFSIGKLCSCPGSWGTRWWRLRPVTASETPTLFCSSMRGP